MSGWLDRTPTLASFGWLLGHEGTIPAPRCCLACAGCHAEDVPQPSSAVSYRERLTPPWWGWLLAAFWASTLAIAYGYAISATIGWLVGIGLFAVAVAALWVMSAVVEVNGDGLRAGRATLPLGVVSAVRALDADAARVTRGTGADPSAFSMMRGWVREAVVVDLDDPTDPTPYWYVSSRHPDDLAAAIGRAAMTGSEPHHR